jgi:hypothetical protein
MSTFSLSRVGLLSLSLALGALLATGPVTGQDKAAAKPAAKSEKKEKSAGRLPSHFGQVVTKEQREKIYAVQAKFTDQILKLRGQIEALETQQKEEVEAVLTPEQREQVAKMAEDAKSKRSKKSVPAEEGAEASQ